MFIIRYKTILLILIFQALSSDLALHHAKVNQLYTMAHGLQSIVTCPGLDSAYEEHLSALLALQDTVNSSLSRLVAFRESWNTYDLLANRLEDWMKSVSNVETETPTSMRKFWVNLFSFIYYLFINCIYQKLNSIKII